MSKVEGDVMDLDLKKIIDVVNKKNLFLRLIITLIGSILLAMNYNLFLEKNNLVIGGLSGLSIVVKKLFSWNPTVFIYVATGILIVIGLFTLDKKDLFKGIFVSLLYPFFITFTAPLCEILLKYLEFNDTILIALVSSLLYGFANGIVYKSGFNTGGADILMKMITKYGKIPDGKATFTMNIVIVLLGGIVFNVNNVVYSIIILYLGSAIIDRMLIGISKTKLFYIQTEEIGKVKSFIIEELQTGVTVINIEGGYSKKKGKLLMCVVDNKDYYLFKEAVLQIDPKAFFIIDDCYEVNGGVKRESNNLLERISNEVN